jgi:hypothetical protein
MAAIVNLGPRRPPWLWGSPPRPGHGPGDGDVPPALEPFMTAPGLVFPSLLLRPGPVVASADGTAWVERRALAGLIGAVVAAEGARRAAGGRHGA